MKAPQGVEKVLALATLSPEWREKVLTNPIAAAGEAGVELGGSERGILASISPRTLAGMIDGFGKTLPRPAGLGRLAAGAAAALLVSSLAGCDGCAGPTNGSRPDLPPPNPRKEESHLPATLGIRPDAPPSKDDPPRSPTPPSQSETED